MQQLAGPSDLAFAPGAALQPTPPVCAAHGLGRSLRLKWLRECLGETQKGGYLKRVRESLGPDPFLPLSFCWFLLGQPSLQQSGSGLGGHPHPRHPAEPHAPAAATRSREPLSSNTRALGAGVQAGASGWGSGSHGHRLPEPQCCRLQPRATSRIALNASARHLCTLTAALQGWGCFTNEKTEAACRGGPP